MLTKQEIMGDIGISWTKLKSFTVHCKQITTPAQFYRPDAFPDGHPRLLLKATGIAAK